MISKRSKIQSDALEAIYQNNKFGVLELATGVGKTKIIIDYINNEYEFNNDLKVLIVVPTEKLRDVNLKEEFEKWSDICIYDNNIKKICYASLHKQESLYFDIVILDECHHITEKNYQFFSQNNYKSVIGLTATMPNNFDKRNLLSSINLNTIYKVNLDDAVKYELVSNFDITVHKVALNNTNKNIPAGSKTKPFFQTEKASYDYISKRIDMETDEEKLKFLRLSRMRLISIFNTKFNLCKQLLNSIPANERTIVFCGSIAAANKMSPYSFHSKTTDKSIYEKFKNKEINALSCVNSLNEGHNLSDINNALILQINAQEKNLIQRIGRIIRYRDGHHGNVHIFIYKDTIEESWLEKALLNNNSKINYINYEN